MKTHDEVMAAFDREILRTGKSRNTRKTYATGLLRDGVDVRVIQENMGHTSLATTEIYLHTDGLKTAPSPLDTEIARNVVRFPRTA